MRVLAKSHGAGNAAPLILESQADGGVGVNLGHRQRDEDVNVVKQKLGKLYVDHSSVHRSSDDFGFTAAKVDNFDAKALGQIIQPVRFESLFRWEGVVASVG